MEQYVEHMAPLSYRNDASVGSICNFVMSLGRTFRTSRKAALDRRKHISLRLSVDETGCNRHVSHVVQTSDVVPVPLTASLAIVVGMPDSSTTNQNLHKNLPGHL